MTIIGLAVQRILREKATQGITSNDFQEALNVVSAELPFHLSRLEKELRESKIDLGIISQVSLL